MDGFIDWYNIHFSSIFGVNCAKMCYENLKCIGFDVFDTVILFKKNNELYRENIHAMINVYNALHAKKFNDIDIYKYIKSSTISYDYFVKNYKGYNIFIRFLINNLEYKPCDIKIAIKD